MSLQGTLSTLGITELLELLAKREASGQLDVNTPKGTASFLFADGKISLSEFDFARGVGEDPAEAAFFVGCAEDGDFFYDPHQVEGVPEGEAVDTVLTRSGQVGGQWADVESCIPSVQHIVCRNSQLDGSVTIEPEWWSILEVVGTGKSSTQLAHELEISSLDASTRLKAMIEAGLIVVTDDMAPGKTMIEEDFATAPIPEMAEAPVNEIADSAPVAETGPEPAPVPEMSFSNIDEGELIADSIVPITPDPGQDAVVEPVAPLDPPAVDEEVSLGFSEPTEEEIAAAPAPPVLEEVPALAAEAPVPEDSQAPASSFEATDPGWSENPFGQSEFEGADPASFIEEAAPVAEVAAVEEIAPVADIAPAESFEQVAPIAESTPIAEPTPIIGGDDDASDMYGLDSNLHDMPVAEASPSVADEVMGDLSYLNEDLDQQLAPDASFDPMPLPESAPPAQASPTPEPEMPAPAPQIGESDPFGSLSDLVVDEEGDQDRSSVLKFLRRD